MVLCASVCSVYSGRWWCCVVVTGVGPERRPDNYDVSTLSGVSGLSFDSIFLFALSLFCLVLFAPSVFDFFCFWPSLLPTFQKCLYVYKRVFSSLETGFVLYGHAFGNRPKSCGKGSNCHTVHPRVNKHTHTLLVAPKT